MNVSIEQLLTFVTVYEELSFSKAAMKLNKHRTTTGQVIANLEDTLAVDLFERIGKRIEPTEEGKILYHYAKTMTDQSNVFNKIALSLSYGGLESINFAYTSVVPHQILANIRTHLLNDFPNMKVNFLVKTTAEVKEGMNNGELHFGIVNVDKGQAMNDKDYTYLGQIEFLPFGQKGGELSQLPKEKIFQALCSSKQFILRTFITEGLSKRVIVSADHEEVDQLALVIKLVEEGLGWAWLPRVLSESQYISERLEPLELSELRDGLKLSFSLWNPHSKQLIGIKSSILKGVDEYIAHFRKTHMSHLT
ncbi:LysR family transcriptional regulator [Vibrio parahaemolyticus]|uniref:LysR family transcriptional regulator n=1 Tax=Vibrio mediterranei TaxID=689 RepID=UPI00406987FD